MPPYVEAPLDKLESALKEPPRVRPEPRFVSLDAYSIGVLELLASKRITPDQARQVFGADLKKAIAARCSDPNLIPTAKARLEALFSLR